MIPDLSMRAGLFHVTYPGLVQGSPPAPFPARISTPRWPYGRERFVSIGLERGRPGISPGTMRARVLSRRDAAALFHEPKQDMSRPEISSDTMRCCVPVADFVSWNDPHPKRACEGLGRRSPPAPCASHHSQRSLPGPVTAGRQVRRKNTLICKSALMWIVRFEMVSPEDHPEHYFFGRGTNPVLNSDQVPVQHWKAVAVSHRQHPKAVEMLRSLNYRIARGALIREVKLSRVVDAEIPSTDEGDPEGEVEQSEGDPRDDDPDRGDQSLADPARSVE